LESVDPSGADLHFDLAVCIGSCANIMKKLCPNGIKDESVIAYILLECLKGLDYLHKHSSIHRFDDDWSQCGTQRHLTQYVGRLLACRLRPAETSKQATSLYPARPTFSSVISALRLR